MSAGHVARKVTIAKGINLADFDMLPGAFFGYNRTQDLNTNIS